MIFYCYLNMRNNLNVPKNPINFTIGFQNIEGLHSDCECFLSEITENVKYNIHFLAETWTCEHEQDLTGYKNIFQKGYQTPGVINGRSSGGLYQYVITHQVLPEGRVD